MAGTPFPVFIGQSPVTILLDPSLNSSRISPALVYKLDLPCFGQRLATSLSWLMTSPAS